MTNNVIDFEECWEKRDYERDRKRLMPYYGQRVFGFDYGQLDELVGMLEEYTEEHGEPANAADFLKWVVDETNEQIKFVERVLGLNRTRTYPQKI